MSRPAQEIQSFWGAESNHWTKKGEHPILDKSERRKVLIERALMPYRDEIMQAQSILDIGSGGGSQRYIPELDPAKITAMDITPEMLQGNHANKKVLADARYNLPFQNESFDIAMQFFLNRYLQGREQEDNLREIVRVLRRGGRFFLLDHETFHHPQEADKFEPRFLKEDLEEFCDDMQIQQIDPEICDLSGRLIKGPLYLFTGTRKLNDSLLAKVVFRR